MEELIITREMRENINSYLGYELIHAGEIGHYIYEEAPGLGKIGIEGESGNDLVTNKQLDSQGNIELFRHPHPRLKPGEMKPFHCRLTTVSSIKAKVVIASLFPDEATDNAFMKEHGKEIKNLRKQLRLVIAARRKNLDVKRGKPSSPSKISLMKTDLLREGGLYLYAHDYEMTWPFP